MSVKIDYGALLAEVKAGAKEAFQACRDNPDGKTIFGMFLTISVSDPDDMMREIRWSRTLNTPVVLESYDNWVRSWAPEGGG